MKSSQVQQTLTGGGQDAAADPMILASYGEKTEETQLIQDTQTDETCLEIPCNSSYQFAPDFLVQCLGSCAM